MEWHSVHSGIGMRNRKTRAFYILAILIPELWIKKRALSFRSWRNRKCYWEITFQLHVTVTLYNLCYIYTGVLEFCYRKISAVKQWKSLQGSQSNNLIFFEFPRVSTGAHPLSKKPEDSGYEIGMQPFLRKRHEKNSLWSCEKIACMVTDENIDYFCLRWERSRPDRALGWLWDDGLW